MRLFVPCWAFTLINLNDELRFFRDTLPSCCAPGELFLCSTFRLPAPGK